jgi:hypothetical protein
MSGPDGVDEDLVDLAPLNLDDDEPDFVAFGVDPLQGERRVSPLYGLHSGHSSGLHFSPIRIDLDEEAAVDQVLTSKEHELHASQTSDLIQEAALPVEGRYLDSKAPGHSTDRCSFCLLRMRLPRADLETEED